MNKGVITDIQFSILSERDVLNESVLEITSAKSTGVGTIQDARLGPTIPEIDTKCPTCLEDGINCRGHFGHIMLNYPIIHPLFEKEVLKVLKIFCYSCFRFIRTTMNGQFVHFDKIIKWTDKKYICPHCGIQQPNWSLVDKGALIQMQFSNNTIMCTPLDIHALMSNFYKEDLEKICITTWPENMIITALPIIPPCARPSVYAEDKVNDDHLTIQYIEIIKANSNIETKSQLEDMTEEERKRKLEKREESIHTLIWRLSVLFNNSASKGKYNTTGKVIQGYRQRLCGKNGLARENLMGKRVNQSGRTVIGPEPTLRIDQVSVPAEMAKLLSTNEIVCKYNLSRIEHLIKAGRINTVNGNQVTSDIQLNIGDEISRQLLDNDIVMINRQPTLHKGSMMAAHVVISPAKTLCFNLSITKSFNADFDGDEMNIHVPQSYQEMAELEELCSVGNHILSQRNGSANIVLVQDHILALYLMSYEKDKLDSGRINDMLLKLVDSTGHNWSLSAIQKRSRQIQKNLDLCSGAAIISFCLPDTFLYKTDRICIEKGVLLDGVINKTICAQIIQNLYHIYGANETCATINNLQFVADAWLNARGFTIGLKDCLLVTEESRTDVRKSILECFAKAEAIEKTIHHSRIREVRIQEELNNARNIGMRIAKNGFLQTNNFNHTISSGSKGDFFNVAQISGILGQQYLNGRRIDMQLNNGRRTLSHYLFKINDIKHKYESRGFIRHSFLRGLDPREMYSHAVVGRAGVVATAMGTSESGYMQRRIVKLMEDVHVTNDGTVRDESNQIYQFHYGDGLSVVHSPDANILDSIVESIQN